MLASEQPGEADVARRKLIEHLAHHRLSLNDVAARLREPQRMTPAGGGEMGLERQLHIARVARQEAEFDVQRARQRVFELSRSLQEAGFDVARAQRGQTRARLVASAGWLLAVVATAWLMGQVVQRRQAAGEPAGSSQAMLRPTDPDTNLQALHPTRSEAIGTVLVQDLPVRLSPNDEGEIRAFLNRGTRVVLERQQRVGVQTWLLIRSISGSGWVRSGDILH